ncbi:hypothetical protein BDQ17DRAFT_1324920 [Cyathus striatus]|nr:hypothetical protein BDQ17DRAFT_1324920 [Cyathus striatus]
MEKPCLSCLWGSYQFKQVFHSVTVNGLTEYVELWYFLMPTDDPTYSADVQSHTIKVAPFPFNDERADIILRTSDDVHFYLYRVLLCIASTTFADMFSFPQGTASLNSRPTVDVSESSLALQSLLKWCDPRCKPDTHLNNLGVVLEMADKYGMDAIVEHLAGEDPVGAVQVYSIVIKHHDKYPWAEEVARTAARETTKIPLPFPNLAEFEMLPATALQALYRYHLACREAAQEVSDNKTRWMGWSDASNRPCDMQCKNCVKAQIIWDDANLLRWNYSIPPLWFYEYIVCTREMLAARPSSQTIAHRHPLSLLKTKPCGSCDRFSLYAKLDEFAKKYAKEVEAAVGKVTLEL